MHRRVFISSALTSLFISAKTVLGGNLPAFSASTLTLPASTLPALTLPAPAVTVPVVATFTAVDKALLAKQMDAYYNGLERYLALTGLSGDILSPDDYQRLVLKTTTSIGDLQ